jgi:excinuclease ABC subunit B
MPFQIKAPYSPAGDQPRPSGSSLKDFRQENATRPCWVLLAVKNIHHSKCHPGGTKTDLVLTHNKTLVAQLYGEFKQFFPDNAVGYFVSYYDYYQPEAYMPVSDTYIERTWPLMRSG